MWDRNYVWQFKSLMLYLVLITCQICLETSFGFCLCTSHILPHRELQLCLCLSAECAHTCKLPQALCYMASLCEPALYGRKSLYFPFLNPFCYVKHPLPKTYFSCIIVVETAVRITSCLLCVRPRMWIQVRTTKTSGFSPSGRQGLARPEKVHL